MVTNQLADSISKSGALGLARTFEQQLNRPHATSMAGNEPTTAAKPTLSAGVATDRPKTHAETNQAGGKGPVTATHHAIHPLKRS